MSSYSPPYSADKVVAPESGGLEVVDHGQSLPQVVDGFKMKPMESGYGAAAAVEGSKILGLRRTTFIMAVILVLVIIAAAVGGGVGGSMAVSSAYDRGFGDARAELAFEAPTETSSPQSDDDEAEDADETEEATPSQSGRIEIPPVRGQVPLDCPNLDEGTHDVAPQKKTYTFRTTCGADSGPGEGDKNIMTITAYRFADCMRACASLNDRGNVGDGKVCGAVRFHTDLAFVGSHGGNCWLKKGFDTLVFDKNDNSKNNHIFAELQD